MPSVRTMDPSLNPALKKAATDTSTQLLQEFCAVCTPHAMRRFEGAFVDAVKAYVEYTLLGQPRHAVVHLKEAREWLEKAKKLSGGSDGNQAEPARR